MPTRFIIFSIPYAVILIFGYMIAWRRFRTAGIFGWTALAALLQLILAASTDTGRRFEVMAPFIISFLGFALGTLINLNSANRN